MTHQFYFYADQLFFAFVKRTLENHPEDQRSRREASAASIVALVAALEALVNALLIDDGRLEHYDELRLRSKIETLAKWQTFEIK